MTTVLMALSASDHWTLKDGTQHPTGFWAEEFLVPFDTFSGAGFDITIATPGAKAPTVDPMSLSLRGAVLPHVAKRQRTRLEELAALLNTPADLHDMAAEDFDIIFYPGGHGPMEDLAIDRASGALLESGLASDKMIGLLCHSPAALLATVGADGRTPFAGKNITALSNTEERLNLLAGKAKWLLEDRLKEAGLRYHKAALPFRPHIIRDGNLFTGQNPQSSKELAEAMVAAQI